MLDANGRFLLNDFQRQRPFSSLLPGIAGPMGIPMWAFYTNRGQALAAFGVQDKDHAFMEFQPANKAYQLAAYTGFRTFLKRADAPGKVYEPFAPWHTVDTARRDMFTGMNEVEIQETNPAAGLQVNVLYFTLPGEPFAALVRQVTIRNTGAARIDLEILDGMPAAIPYGVDDRLLKDMHRTAEAWMAVFHLEQGTPFYRVGASIGDSAEVQMVEKGFFAIATAAGQLLPPVVDPGIVFEQDTSLYAPTGFQRQALSDLLRQPQQTRGKTPCAFFALEASLAPGEAVTLVSAFGMADDARRLAQVQARLLRPGYVEEKRAEARQLAETLTEKIACHTAFPVFDAYARQTFLDNVLRGGWPVLLGDPEHPAVYHLYSRKHGDLERDYNAFFLADEHYSQGNGNFRDTVQNRRSDVFFNPAIGDFNLRTFLSLIQPDGYNPLVVKGSRFTLAPQDQAALAQGQPALAAVLGRAFTPGELLRAATNPQTGLDEPAEVYLQRVLSRVHQQIEADFGEGYWTDHWFYLLDLLDSYLAVYPERKTDLLFGAADIPYYDSAHIVKPRARKTMRIGDTVRQYDALELDGEKAALIAARAEMPNQVRAGHGQGQVFYTSVFGKLAGLAAVKFTALDPLGMGLEMEAGKPGWCDALNGLPGLFGSSLAESLELERLLAFLLGSLAENRGAAVDLPVELADLLRQLSAAQDVWQAASPQTRDFAYWDMAATLREQYRQRTRLGFDGALARLTAAELAAIFQAFLSRLAAGTQRAMDFNGGTLPTYLTYTVTRWEEIRDGNGGVQMDPHGRPYVRALSFEPHPLPVFLEGYVHALKVQPNAESARQLVGEVRAGELFDRTLGMYRICASLAAETHEIGRIRAFPPGWLENESIFLHMEYKYLLELLKAGLYAEFFADFRAALIPFQNVARYGRSPLENASFLASSAYADPAVHGGGFIARLSGATAEFLSMWNILMAGKQPFVVHEGKLALQLRPILPGWLFPADGKLSFCFLGSCRVTLHNPRRLDTFNGDLRLINVVIDWADGERTELPGGVIGAPYAQRIRSGQARSMDLFYAGGG